MLKFLSICYAVDEFINIFRINYVQRKIFACLFHISCSVIPGLWDLNILPYYLTFYDDFLNFKHPHLENL